MPFESPRDAKARAKAENAYRKATRPFYKKKRVLIPLILVVIIVIAAVASSNHDKQVIAAAAKTCAGKTYPDQQNKDVCADAAGSVKLGGLTITATSFTPKSDDIGGSALCSTLTLQNVSDSSQDYNELDFKVQTPSGDVATTSTLNFASTLNSGTIIKGATKTGLLCTDDKGEKGQYVLIYKPNVLESDRGIWLFSV